MFHDLLLVFILLESREGNNLDCVNTPTEGELEHVQGQGQVVVAGRKSGRNLKKLREREAAKVLLKMQIIHRYSSLMFTLTFTRGHIVAMWGKRGRNPISVDVAVAAQSASRSARVPLAGRDADAGAAAVSPANPVLRPQPHLCPRGWRLLSFGRTLRRPERESVRRTGRRRTAATPTPSQGRTPHRELLEIHPAPRQPFAWWPPWLRPGACGLWGFGHYWGHARCSVFAARVAHTQG